MPSSQSHLVSLALRALVKRNSHANFDVARARHWTDRLLSLPLPHLQVRFRDFSSGRLNGEWVDSQSPGPMLLYLHGGGYFFCSPRTHRPMTAYLTRSLGGSTLALKYRLAPEHPFPAALEDAMEAYRWLLAQGHSPERIVVAGDSAGGGLVLSTLVALRQAGLPMPAAAACFSPWTDLAATGSSLDANDRHCAMFSAAGIRSARRLYLGEADPYDPRVSPLYADLAGLPPLLIHVSDNEVLLDDSLRMAERARQAGVAVSLKVWENLPHVWQLFQRLVPEGKESLREAGQFLTSHLGAGSSFELPFSLP